MMETRKSYLALIFATYLLYMLFYPFQLLGHFGKKSNYSLQSPFKSKIKSTIILAFLGIDQPFTKFSYRVNYMSS